MTLAVDRAVKPQHEQKYIQNSVKFVDKLQTDAEHVHLRYTSVPLLRYLL